MVTVLNALVSIILRRDERHEFFAVQNRFLYSPAVVNVKEKKSSVEFKAFSFFTENQKL